MDDTTTANCTLRQAGTIIQALLRRLLEDPEQAVLVPPVMLWGAPGIGKSALVREICANEGIGFIDVRLAQREPVDLRGLPVPDEGVVRWLPAAEWPRDPNSRGIILFDELTAADRTLQVAAYEFILDRRLGDLYRVPDGWLVMGAGNRATDRAVAQGMSSALANRFCHLELEADLDAWCDWARGAGIDPQVIAFLRYRPKLLFAMEGDCQRGWPSPRAWERVSGCLAMAADGGLEGDCLRLAIAGLVGRGAAVEFLAFLSWAERLPDVLGMLMGTIPPQVPERADQRFALCCAAVHHLRRRSNEQRIVRGFIDLGLALPSDFAAMAMVDAIGGGEGNADLAVTLTGHPHFEAWTRKHGPAFAARMQAAGKDAA